MFLKAINSFCLSQIIILPIDTDLTCKIGSFPTTTNAAKMEENQP
jgi:hypothetical protein